jgi:hypothetical protein
MRFADNYLDLSRMYPTPRADLEVILLNDDLNAAEKCLKNAVLSNFEPPPDVDQGQLTENRTPQAFCFR